MLRLPSVTSLSHPIIADGAMGTALFAAGLPIGASPEAWLLTGDGVEAVTRIHRDHVTAGSEIILTATFGANPLRLAGSEVEGRCEAICRTAVAAARAAAARNVAETGVGRAILVAGSLGPTGGVLDPYGPLDPGAVRAAYAEEATLLADAGVDLLWVETMMDLREALAAVDGAREAAPGLPVVATMVFSRGRTLFGDRPEAVGTQLAEHGVAGVGANCGDGFSSVEDVIGALAAAAPGIHVIAKTNAGLPVADADGDTRYPATPAEAAAHARRVADLGATIIGGCCGTTAAHIAAIRAAVGAR